MFSMTCEYAFCEILQPMLKAIDDIRFKGYANLETTSPSGNIEKDTKRNLIYLHNLMSKA